MPAWFRSLTRFIHRQRRLLRGLLAMAVLVLLADGFLVERSLVHLLLLHPLLLMALLVGLVLTESPDASERSDGD
jgi:hypothetical protein